MSTLEVKAIQAPSGYNLQMPAGHIIQTVKSNVRTSNDTTTSSTPAEIHTDFRVTITPKSTSSSIILMCFMNVTLHTVTHGSMGIYRSIGGGGFSKVTVGNGHETFRNRDSVTEHNSSTLLHYDSPNTTSQCIYTPYFWRQGGSGNFTTNDNPMGSFMLAMEVQG